MQPWFDILSSMGSSGVDVHQGRKKNELLVPPRLSHPLSHRQRFGGKEGAWKWWEAKRFGSAELESSLPWDMLLFPACFPGTGNAPGYNPTATGKRFPLTAQRGCPGVAVPGSLLTSARGQPSARACAAGNPQELKNPFLKRRAEGNEKRSPTDSDPARCSVFKSTVLAWGTAE